MNESAQRYFNKIKKLWLLAIFGLLYYYFICLPLAVIVSPYSPWLTASLHLSALPTIGYLTYNGMIYEHYKKKKEYFYLKRQNNPVNNIQIDELEEYFSNPKLQWKFYFPWEFCHSFVKDIFVEIFYGQTAPGNIFFLRLDLLQKVLLKFYNLKVKESQEFNFDLLPITMKSRFIELQCPYAKYKLHCALPNNSKFKIPQQLIVDNLEIHFGKDSIFYSKWLYLRYLNCSDKNNLIIDMPWQSITNIFKYFLAPLNDKFVLTFTAKDNNQTSLKVTPIHSILLSSMPSNSLFTTFKSFNIFSIKKLEIVESRLSEDDLKFLKTLKLKSLTLNLSLCESYQNIDCILEAVQGIPDIIIDITFSFYLKGYFETCAVKWVKKYGYPKNFVFIIKILNQFHIKFL